jgi:hypothetical protein
MLRKSIILFFLSFLLIGTCSSFAQCEKLKKKKIHQLLGAAHYDNSASTKIQTYDVTYKEEYQINLFKEVVYKMVFDVSNMSEGVIIKLVDLGKKRGAGKYEEVFNSETATKTKNETFEVTLEFPQRKLLVQYEVINNTKPGCVSFVLGYYLKNRIK